MACVSLKKIVVLINGIPSKMFNGNRGLRKGCPSSPLLFILIVEGLNRLTEKYFGRVVFEGGLKSWLGNLKDEWV